MRQLGHRRPQPRYRHRHSQSVRCMPAMRGQRRRQAHPGRSTQHSSRRAACARQAIHPSRAGSAAGVSYNLSGIRDTFIMTFSLMCHYWLYPGSPQYGKCVRKRMGKTGATKGARLEQRRGKTDFRTRKLCSKALLDSETANIRSAPICTKRTIIPGVSICTKRTITPEFGRIYSLP